jgi:hypothetical protein
MKCYYCGNTANTKEHIPPKSIFSSIVCDKFTVPSCADHNTEKSNEDDSIIKGMLISLSYHGNKLDPAVKKAISVSKPHFKQVKSTIKTTNFIYDLPEANTELAYINGKVKMKDWYSKISAGIVYTAIKKYEMRNRYDETIVYNLSYYASKDLGITKNEFEKEYYRNQYTLKTFDKMKWIDGWKSGPINYPKELYYFRLSIVNNFLFIQHVFFDSYIVICRIMICDNTKNILVKKYAVPQQAID